jgi:enoyl-CoA hydratase
MEQSSYQKILLSRRGRVLTLTLNAPETLNATDSVLHEELSRVFADAAADPESDIIVLTGAGRAFSAGGDVDAMQLSIDNPELFETVIFEAKRIIFSLLDCEKPVIAKVNGHAMGLGATIALFCDIIYAADHAKIGDPHVSVGFVAGDGGSVIWPQLIGYARAKEYLFTGKAMTAARAAEIGLINHALPAAELDAAVDRFADELAAGATKAIRWTKTTVNIPLKQLAPSMMDVGLGYEAMSNLTSEHRDLVRAFREKAGKA